MRLLDVCRQTQTETMPLLDRSPLAGYLVVLELDARKQAHRKIQCIRP